MRSCIVFSFEAQFFSEQNELSFTQDQQSHLADDGTPLKLSFQPPCSKNRLPTGIYFSSNGQIHRKYYWSNALAYRSGIRSIFLQIDGMPHTNIFRELLEHHGREP